MSDNTVPLSGGTDTITLLSRKSHFVRQIEKRSFHIYFYMRAFSLKATYSES